MEQTLYFGGKRKSTETGISGITKLWSHRTQFDNDPETQFRGYIGRIWVNEHKVPDSDEELCLIDLDALREAHRDFVGNGGKQPARGATLEESYLLFMITLRTRAICMINIQQPIQPAGRIFHKAFLDPGLLVRSLRQALESRTFRSFIGRGLTGTAPLLRHELRASEEDWGSMYTVLTYDGETGHAITVCGWDPSTDSFIYHDPWPGISLLCAGNNVAGVSAYPYLSHLNERLWLIGHTDMERVIYAYTMPMRQWDYLLRDL